MSGLAITMLILNVFSLTLMLIISFKVLKNGKNPESQEMLNKQNELIVKLDNFIPQNKVEHKEHKYELNSMNKLLFETSHILKKISEKL